MRVMRVFLVLTLIVLLFFLASEIKSPTGLLWLADANASKCFKASDLVGPGETIFLNESIVQVNPGYCITLDVENVTLDCQGYNITGAEGCDGAILIANDSVTVINCSFDLFSAGRVVYGEKVSDAEVIKNTLKNNEMITLKGSDIRIIDNVIDPVSAREQSSGLLLEGSGVVAGNTIANGVSFTVTVTGENLTVENNTVRNIVGIAYKIVNADNVTFRNNTALNVTGIAVDIDNSTNVDAYNNTISFFNERAINIMNLFFPLLPSMPESGYAFRLFESENVTLYDNIINLSNLGLLPVENDGVVAAECVDVDILNNSFRQLRNCIVTIGSNDSLVENNTLQDCVHKSVVIDGGSGNAVKGNRMIASPSADDVFLFKRGLEFFRTTSASSATNRIAGYRTGLYVYDVTRSVFDHDNISATAQGVYSFMSSNNVFDKLRISSSVVGLKFLYTNSSLVNRSNFTASRNGFELSQSFSNNLTNDRFTAVSSLADHNSALNNISSNTFVSSGSYDVIFDLFANNNSGTANTIPLGFFERNFASGNSVT